MGAQLTWSGWPAIWASLMAEAPSMDGTAMRKLNWAAHRRLRPQSMAMQMVAPLREMPGVMARPWAMPTSRAAGRPKRRQPRRGRGRISAASSNPPVTSRARPMVMGRAKADSK